MQPYRTPWHSQTYLLGLSLITAAFLMSMMTSAVNPGCKCVRFTSTYGKEWGSFSSPDYPRVYPPGIRCLLYSFLAPKDYIIQVQFAQINLPHPHNAASGCATTDYLKLFVHLDEDGVNELTPWNSLLCGQLYNQTFYSSSRTLILQFHSVPHRSPSMKEEFGFTGLFRFLNASQFESQGRLVPGTKCDYQFQSANYTAAHGRFFSPMYPSTYPHNTQCAYHFHGSLHERVKIVFESVALQEGDYSCLNKSDIIRVLDGSTAKAPVIALLCNALKDYEILSSGPNLQIEFISNSDKPGEGFRAKYYFVKVQLDQSYDTFSPFGGISGSDSLNHGLGGLPQASTLVPQCNHVITSDAGKNGSFTSPNYPHPYPAKTHCRYDFIGHGKERVQIVFEDFNLYHPEESLNTGSGKASLSKLNKYKSCTGTDVLSVFVYTESNLARIDDFCGSNTPLAVMSNGHKLTLEFNAPQSSRHSRGFQAHYYFLEDYAIRSGRQLPDYPCAFLFNSSLAEGGNFSSPNYPGFYPRDTECHYFFHAKGNEHVEIKFNHFHVDGVEPCEEDTHSDSVEFSNYMPTDGKFKRYCGPLHDLRVRSDGKFFRVTFRSNFKYDATGFHATYMFTQVPTFTVNTRSRKPAVRSSGSRVVEAHVALEIALVIILLALCQCASALR